MEKLIIACGCFWGAQELFRIQRGVVGTRVGYCGGNTVSPSYEQVCEGNTGHAEAVWIDFDPAVTSRTELLRFFFKMHDPTTYHRQGGDRGSQYRSVIFVSSKGEEVEAKGVIDEVTSSGFWPDPIVTTLEWLADPKKGFYLAESYHQDYLQKNPKGYSCHFVRSHGGK